MGRTYTICSCESQAQSCQQNSSGFTIHQNDSCPDFRFQAKSSVDGTMISYENWTVEASMFFQAEISSLIDTSYSQGLQGRVYSNLILVNDQNLGQVKVGDVIETLDEIQQNTEKMLVEQVSSSGIIVRRAYDSTAKVDHDKYTNMNIYRFVDQDGYVDSQYPDDPDSAPDFSIIGYSWSSGDTSFRGNYMLRFKLSSQVLDDQGSLVKTIVRTFPVGSIGFPITVN